MSRAKCLRERAVRVVVVVGPAEAEAVLPGLLHLGGAVAPLPVFALGGEEEVAGGVAAEQRRSRASISLRTSSNPASSFSKSRRRVERFGSFGEWLASRGVRRFRSASQSMPSTAAMLDTRRAVHRPSSCRHAAPGRPTIDASIPLSRRQEIHRRLHLDGPGESPRRQSATPGETCPRRSKVLTPPRSAAATPPPEAGTPRVIGGKMNRVDEVGKSRARFRHQAAASTSPPSERE